MTPFERAMILGEKNISILDMLNHEDREKLRNARRLAEGKKAPEPVKEEVVDDPFIEDEEKSYRFKKYIQCLKRGLLVLFAMKFTVFFKISFNDNIF